MLLRDLITTENSALQSLEVKGVTCDSSAVKEGFLFVCIQGTRFDGHTFAEKALESGAVAVVVERDLGLENQIIVENTHAAYASLCAKWFGNPADELTLVGVTGTNGKTSVTYMIKKILEAAGHKVGLVGTIQNMIGDEIIATQNTTPNAYELNSLFKKMKDEGCKYVVMEVSSHALDQCRVYQLNFDVAVFTNLTQDHLDYHVTMENYLAAKKRLFSMCKTAVINKDDEYAAELMKDLDCEIVTYSTGNDATFSAKAIQYRPAKVEYELVSNTILRHMRVHVGGQFSVYNSMASAIAAVCLGISDELVANALDTLEGVKGRAEVVPTGRDFTVIIDYAHTPDGLKNILKTFKECKKNRLIVLFGCGGDRDKTKRPLMGGVAVRLADYCIITSDNPRTEDPSAIIEDILTGVSGVKTPYKVIENRIEAIHYAISMAETDDIIVLAGKGHETYQILKEGTIHLDEREIVRDALANLKD